MGNYEFKWADLAFGNKKVINNLNAVFIAASREFSNKRFSQLIKTFLPKNNIVLGFTDEAYVLGFEKQPQFKMLEISTLKKLIDRVNIESPKHKIYTLNYAQRETIYVIDKLKFKKVLFINGSWKYAFHNSEIFYMLHSKKIDFELISPFINEQEAKSYLTRVEPMINKSIFKPNNKKIYSQSEMIRFVNEYAKKSFDHNFQTAAILGKKVVGGYKFLAYSYNKIVPYDSYALHYGSVREKHFSPPNDLNYYDTVHAEVYLLIKTNEQKINLCDTTLFINLLPCPTCSRMLSRTRISQINYQLNHSSGEAIWLLEQSGKKLFLTKE